MWIILGNQGNDGQGVSMTLILNHQGMITKDNACWYT
jgi:hypothetical protein